MSESDSCAPGWERSRRQITRVPSGHAERSTRPVSSVAQAPLRGWPSALPPDPRRRHPWLEPRGALEPGRAAVAACRPRCRDGVAGRVDRALGPSDRRAAARPPRPQRPDGSNRLGPVDIRTPRDREGSFAPQIVSVRRLRRNASWLELALLAHDITVWTSSSASTVHTVSEPKRLRYRTLYRRPLTRHVCRLTLHLPDNWP